MNVTFLSLSINSLFSMSPLYMINNNGYRRFSSIANSFFTKSFATIIYANTEHHSTLINNNIFSNMLETPLIFIKETGTCSYNPNEKQCCFDTNYENNKKHEFKEMNIEGDGISDKNAIFNNDCGDIYITICNFFKCKTSNDFGGGIRIEQNCHVILHHSIFDNCKSNKHGPGGAIATKLEVTEYNDNEQKQRPNDPTHLNTKKIDIQYTCFQNCYTDSNLCFGSALTLGAQDVKLFYASTVNCPGPNIKAWGAQFDVKASNSISSQYVNATGGNSLFCGSIEYRDANIGFFQFQTITKMTCKYATSFTSVNINGLKITSCNVHNNIIQNNEYDTGETKTKPGLIYVRKKDILIDNFYFYDNTICEGGLLVTRDIDEENKDVKIILSNCYADTNDRSYWTETYIETKNCQFEEELKETLHLSLLSLGDCQGEATPGPMIISAFFTPSTEFSGSSEYTKSDAFSYSKEFSETQKFSHSQYFSETDFFSGSVKFTKTDAFEKSSEFTKSDAFEKSSEFTKSDAFEKSSEFTKSDAFEKSNEFTKSDAFEKSNEFTKSDAFEKSSEFTKSDAFEKSNEFTKSCEFSKTNGFSKTAVFSETRNFSQSDNFTQSNAFDKTKEFTKSSDFTKSSEFTHSRTFTSTKQFSKSSIFSASLNFSDSEFLVPVVDKDANAGSGGKSNTGTIIGAVIGSVAAAAIIAALVAFFIWKKKHSMFNENSADMIDEQESVITVDNNLNTVMKDDDPFAAEFIDND